MTDEKQSVDAPQASSQLDSERQPRKRNTRTADKTSKKKQRTKPQVETIHPENDEEQDSGDELNHEPDPLFDPERDDKDEAWVRKNCMPQGGRKSDAVLCCPACFTLLCFDCQQHDEYANQYRAMFVQNCKVLKQEVRPTEIGDDDPEMRYRAVVCSRCSTNIAVYDTEEIYHFFNVLAAQS